MMAGTMVLSVRDETQTVDEGVHLAAGYSYWQTGDFRLNPEHPPLVKLMASVPLLFLPIHLPDPSDGWLARNAWSFARSLLYHNTVDAETILFLGRLPVMLLALALGLLIACWAKRLWGTAGGVLALVLYAFDPNFLAHGRYVTTDVGVALGIAATVWAFCRYLEWPTGTRMVIVAVFFALTQMTKFSAVLLWPILLLLWVLRAWTAPALQGVQFAIRDAVRFFLLLAGATAIAAWILYGFTFRVPVSDPDVASLYANESIWQETSDKPGTVRLLLALSNPAQPVGGALAWIARNVPLSAFPYVRGLVDVTLHNAWGHEAYFLGEFGSTGWMWYFPVALLVKTPFATLLLLLVGFAYFARQQWDRFVRRRRSGAPDFAAGARRARAIDFSHLALIAPSAVFLLFSMTSTINLGVRHILPVYPFLFVLAGGIATIRFRRPLQRLWHVVLGGLMGLLVISSVFTYPHYLSYFSELVGGADQGARYLTDSNLDWGQELRRFARYLDAHDIPWVAMAYFGQAPMDAYLSDVRSLPTDSEPERIAVFDGWAAISVSALVSADHAYDWLLRYKPTATVGGAIYLYDFRKSPRSD